MNDLLWLSPSVETVEARSWLPWRVKKRFKPPAACLPLPGCWIEPNKLLIRAPGRHWKDRRKKRGVNNDTAIILMHSGGKPCGEKLPRKLGACPLWSYACTRTRRAAERDGGGGGSDTKRKSKQASHPPSKSDNWEKRCENSCEIFAVAHVGNLFFDECFYLLSLGKKSIFVNLLLKLRVWRETCLKLLVRAEKDRDIFVCAGKKWGKEQS